MGKKKNLSSLEPEEVDFVKEKMSGYHPEAMNYQLRNKGLDFKVNLKFKNEKQKELHDAIKDNQVTFCSGKAGTGKSFVAFATALSLLKDNDNFYRKIILIVPTVQADIELGFLKGSLDDKIGPHAEAHLYTMEKIINKSNGGIYEDGIVSGKMVVETLRRYELIEIKPVSFLRGYTFDNCLLVIEESQNFPKSAFKTILTRLGDNCKMIFLGDIDQIDNREIKKTKEKCGLEFAMEAQQGLPDIGIVRFGKNDKTVRNLLIEKMLDRWEAKEKEEGQ